jgi:hypothetical protein
MPGRHGAIVAGDAAAAVLNAMRVLLPDKKRRACTPREELRQVNCAAVVALREVAAAQ